MSSQVKTTKSISVLYAIFLFITSACTPTTRVDTHPSPPVPNAITSYPSPPVISSTPFIATWTNPVHLKYGEKIILNDGFQITFSDVIEDNRCLTTEANCSQEGNAKILLIIQSDTGYGYKIFLNSNPKFSQNAWTEGHWIFFIKINPDPPVAAPSKKTDYEIWIQILLL
jgi:hypothetical protein